MSQWTDFLDFTGSILSGVIGGAMTYYGVKLTLDRTQKDKTEEDNRTSIKDIIKLIKIIEQYSKKAEDTIISFKGFFEKFPTERQYEAGFTNHLLHDHIKELVSKFDTKAREYMNAFDNVYYDALEISSLIDRKAMVSVTSTFGEIRKHLHNEKALTTTIRTPKNQFEFFHANYESIKLMHRLLRELQNGLIDRLDNDLNYYYKEYKD